MLAAGAAWAVSTPAVAQEAGKPAKTHEAKAKAKSKPAKAQTTKPKPSKAAKAKPAKKSAKAKPAKAEPAAKSTAHKPEHAKTVVEKPVEKGAKSKTGKPEPAKPAAEGKKADTSAMAFAGEATLLGQYGDWGAYAASPSGHKVCFALAKPTSSQASREGIKRDQPYLFIATRPAENVKNEISVVLGYPLKTEEGATAEVGTANFALFTQKDGAWIKNAAEEPQLVQSMRKGADLVLKGVSARGTRTTDTYSLKGVAEALDKVAQACK